MTATQARAQDQTSPTGMMWLLYLVGAGLLVASGAIHLLLWDIAYRHVKTLNALFLVQAIGTVLAAIVLLVTRHFLIAIGCALLMAGTIVGFKLPYITTEAWIVLAIEAVGVVLLSITAWLSLKQRTN